MKKRLLHSVSMLVFLICTAFTAWAGEVTLTILHTNDSHGAGAEVTKKAFSYAQIAALADSITPRPVLLDAGDIVEGSVFASETEGLLSINAMRLAGYDAVTLGNHEFNRFRKSTIERLTGAAGGSLKGNAVTIVNANVSGSSELDKLPAYTIIERDGVRIGVFGLTTTSTMGTANPAHNKGLTFEHGITVAKRTVAEMKALPANKRPHIIVALVHMGFEPGMTEPEYDLSGAVAAQVDGIDLIIDGHAHQVMLGEGSAGNNAQMVNGTKIVSAGSSLAYIGRVDMIVDTNSGELLSMTSSGISAAEQAASLPSDKEVAAYLKTVVDEVNGRLGQVFARSSVTLYGGNYSNGDVSAQICRRGETNLIALIADAKKYTAEQVLAEAGDGLASFNLKGLPVLALQCGGGVRNSISAGDITYRDISNLFINGGTNDGGYYVKAKGKVVWEMIEWGLSTLTAQDGVTGTISADGSTHGRFPVVAGVKYTYDITKPGSTPTKWDGISEMTMGSRLTKVVLEDGTELTKDSERWVVLVISKYEMNGGDNYYCFKNAKERGELELIIENGSTYAAATINYLKKLYEKGDIYYPLSSGRIVPESSAYTKDSFTSVLTLKTAQGALAGQGFTLEVNEGRGTASAWRSLGSFVTDANGQYSVSLNNGPQELRVTAEREGVKDSSLMYVDNYAGLVNSTHTLALPAGVIVYTVVSGDSLWRIGMQYNMSWQKIAEANGLAEPYLIYPGQLLTIP